MIITIDGPTASGKGSVARAIAAHKGYFYLDTGLLYRAMGLLAARDFSREQVDRADFWTAELVERYKSRIRYWYAEDVAHVAIDDEEVTAQLRTPDIDWFASHVSSVPLVRMGLRAMQRDLGARYDIVIDGRDCGTVLFPQAEVKFFLTAGLEARVVRAHADTARRATGMTLAQVREAVLMRDMRDLTRPISPLKPAPDAIILDTSLLGREATTLLVLSYL